MEDGQADRLDGLVEHMLDLGCREVADDLQRRLARVVDGVRHELRHDSERAGLESRSLVADDGLARAVDDVEDLLCAVRVAPEMVARLDLEIHDRAALRPGGCMEREVDACPHRWICVVPGLHELKLSHIHRGPPLFWVYT